MKKQLDPADYLLARKTIEIRENYWPHHGDFWLGTNAGSKYILSVTRKNSDWNNSVFLGSVGKIKALKNTNGPNTQV